MVVNGCPLLAVQAHVPPENLVVSNSNQVVTMLRVTDTVQAHVIALGAGAQLTYRVGAALFQVSSLVSWYVSLKHLPVRLERMCRPLSPLLKQPSLLLHFHQS